jgi:hypothetical protein
MSNPEQLNNSERSVETPKVSAEQLERLSNPETAAELDVESGEKKEARARVEALEVAVSVEKSGAEKDKKPGTAAPRRRGAINKKEK